MIRWIARQWFWLTGAPVPLWALPKLGKMGVIDRY